MKAKYVYESVEFQRGKDPKAAMGLGPIEKLKQDLAKLAISYDLDLTDDKSKEHGYIWFYDWAGNYIKLHWNKIDMNPIMILENSEEGYEKIVGFEKIREFIDSGKLAQFFFL